MSYIINRIIVFVSLLAIVVGAFLLYFHILDDRAFAVISGILAIIVPIAGIFAVKSADPIDFEAELYKIKKDLDSDLSTRLSQKEALNEYINNQSIEILLIKLKNITEEAIMSRYKNSDIAPLIEELGRIEAQLDALNSKYDVIDLPERFKQLIQNLKRADEFNMYIDVIAAMPFFGKLMAAPLRVMNNRGLLSVALLRYQKEQTVRKVTKNNTDNEIEVSAEKVQENKENL